MNNNYLNDEANSLRIQNHQVSESQNKISEIDIILRNIEKEQQKDNKKLDQLLIEMESLLAVKDSQEFSEIDSFLLNIKVEQEISFSTNVVSRAMIGEIETIDFNHNMSWNEYLKSIEEYSFKNNIDLTEDPFKHIMTKTQQVELQKRIKEEFSLKNAKCDKYDYMIAGTCGIISGLIDIFFVGIPGNSILGDFTDKQANNITEKFAELLGWDKSKAEERGSDTTKSAIGWLERKFKINYDQASTNGRNGTGGLVENLSASNHHLKSLGHSPDIIGLFFSVLNQFTNTSSFINNGKIITMDTETFELQGGNFIAKVFCGVANWFGHLLSDWTGSSGATGRGSGIPIPFYNLLQMINIGEFGQHKQTFATITTKVFEQGYDFRHGMAMAIPVLINELLIRFMYTMKARFYHEKDWKDCIPNGTIPELRRMLLVGHGTLCIMDGADAAIRSGGDMIQFLLRTNLIAWVRFGHLSLKELNAWWNEGKMDIDAIEQYLDDELKNMLKK
jgi:hypothetical protein